MRHAPSKKNRFVKRLRLVFERLEERCLLSAAHEIIDLTDLRNDPIFSAIDGRLGNNERIGVAVIDSGVFANHVDLRERFLVYYDAVTRAPASRNISDARDPHGHGTHVAGIVLGGFSATLQDTVGVAPQAGLVAVRGLPSDDEAQPRHDTVLESLNWVLANHAQFNIKVVNMSLGFHTINVNSSQPDNDYARVIRSLENVGVTVVSASGNEFAHFNQLGHSSPAVFSSLSVGNILPASESRQYVSGGYNPTVGVDLTPTGGTFDVSSQRSTMSNQVIAPGHGTVSTFNNGQYETMGGTSQASPHVAGLVALMQDAASTFGGRFLTVSEVVSILRNTADTLVDQPDPDTIRFPRNGNTIDFTRRSDLTETGQSFRRVNALRAMQAVRTLVSQGNDGGGVVPPDADTNNIIARAVELPPLNGQALFSFDGRIGQDGQVNVGNNDVDLFRLVLQTPGQLNFVSQVTPNGVPFDAFLRVFDSSGNQIAFNDDAVTGTNLYPALTTGTLAAGTYFVGLSSFANDSYSVVNGSGRQDGQSSGDYRVTITTLNPDPNGVIQGAVPVDLTSPDFVWPVGSPAQQANIFVANKVGSQIGSDPHPLFATDPTRFPERIELGATDVDIFRFTAPDNGRFFVDVESQNVHLDAVDSYVKVFRLESNGLLTLLGENDDEAPGFTDSFLAINVEIGRTYFVALTTFGNRNFDPINPNGRSSSSNETGLMDVYFSFFNGDVNGTAYANVSLNDNPLGVNGIGTFPGTIGSDFGIPLLGANGGFKDVDFLRITAPQSGALQVAVTSPNGTLNAELGIWQLNPTGNDIVQVVAETGQNPVSRFEVTAGQTFWISVTGEGNGGFNWAATGSGTGGDTGEYELTTSFLTLNQLRDSTNNSVNIDTPTPIAVNQFIEASIDVDGASVVGPDDVDIYIFQPTVTQTVEIHAGDSTSEKADVFLRVFNSAGIELAFNDNRSNTTTDAFLNFPAQAGETYYIGVNGNSANARNYNPLTGAGAAPGSQGSYTVSVLAANAPPPAAPNRTLRKNGANVELVDGANQVLLTQPLTSNAPIVVDGLDTQTNSFTLDFASGGVFNVLGGITYNGGALGTDQIIVSGDVNVTLTDSKITVPKASKSININNVRNALLIGGAGNNKLNASKFSGNVIFDGGDGKDTLTGGAGDDEFFIGLGKKTIKGNGGNNKVFADVAGEVKLTNKKLSSEAVKASLSKITAVELFGSGQDDTFNITGWTGVATIQGGSGTDKLINAQNANVTLTDGALTRSLGGLITLASVEAAELTGGKGDNTLDASAFSGFTLLKGLAGRDTLKAGLGGSVLLGGKGDDQLDGNVGRDLLFAGAGANVLKGGAGEDLLFGGATSLESKRARIDALFEFWSNALSFAARVAALQNGSTGIAKFPAFNEKTVKADKLVDTLFGQGDADWFLTRRLTDMQDFVAQTDVSTPG